MKFAFIQTQLASTETMHSHWSAGALCRILSVSRSGYWAWQRRQKQPLSAVQQARQQAESCLRLQIGAAHRKGRCYYGSPRPWGTRFRMNYAIRASGRVSRKRVARLMREEGW